jgi:hypothetical protein
MMQTWTALPPTWQQQHRQHHVHGSSIIAVWLLLLPAVECIAAAPLLKCFLLRLLCAAVSALNCPCAVAAAALHGPLPTSITQLRKLEVLSLESNELSGTLPPNMCRDMVGLQVRAGLGCSARAQWGPLPPFQHAAGLPAYNMQQELAVLAVVWMLHPAAGVCLSGTQL